MNNKKAKISLLCIALVIAIVMTTISAVFANEIVEEAEDTKFGILENAQTGEQIHEKIDISTIRNEGGNPPELLSKASSLADAEKEWYEYIRYCAEPIGICQVNKNSRIIFHDPYDYGNSLIMEVDDSVTDWSSANELTATYETGNTVTVETSKSTDTVTGLEVAKGTDRTNDTSTTTVEGRIETYNESKTQGSVTDETTGGGSTTTTKYGKWSSAVSAGTDIGTDITAEVGGEAGVEGGGVVAKTILNSATTISTHLTANSTITKDSGEDVSTTKIDTATTTTSYSDDYQVTDSGYTEDNTTTTTVSNVETTVADRMSSSFGHNVSETKNWSTSDSHSISKTYNASYFNSSGSPLQWKIVKYKVIMPLMYKTQYLIDGVWVTAESGYCTLTTIQGTCRAWIENNNTFYEHWGTGEPVAWDEFWGTFFTEESLIAAYKSKLYPDQVRSVSAE